MVGTDNSVGSGQGLRGRVGVFSRHHGPLDSRLADGAEFSTQPGTMVPLSGDGYEGNLNFSSHVGHGGGPTPEPSTHGTNTPSLINPHATLNPRSGQEMGSVRSNFAHGHSHQEQSSQPDHLGSVAPEHYMPPNTAISAAGDMDMALYPNALHAHPVSGQVSASLEPAYPHASGASVQPLLHPFPATVQPTGQGGHGQTLDAGYDYSFPPARAPQFGLETASQYAMSDPSSMNPMTHQAGMPPPTFGHSRLSRDFATADSLYPQQARTERHPGEDDPRHRERKRRQSKSPKSEESSEKQSPESDETEERALSSQISKKPRAPFTKEARAETGATRKTGACIRCRIQRSRVRTFMLAPLLCSRLTCDRSASQTRRTGVASAGLVRP